MSAIMIIIFIMVYFFVGILIGMFLDYYDAGMIAGCAALWPVVILLYIPYKLADITYKKIKKWRDYHK